MNYSREELRKRAPFIKNFTSLIKQRKERERETKKLNSCRVHKLFRRAINRKQQIRTEREGKKLIAKRARLRRKAAAS